jgi:ankyrin repeat protein
LCREG